MLGMYPEMQPKFAKRFAEVGEQIMAATRAYIGEVQQRTFPAAEHTFKANGPRRIVQAEQEPLLAESEIPPHWQTH
jgi:3-methyl-2-oxobutanoate hydroxymethyltransferase